MWKKFLAAVIVIVIAAGWYISLAGFHAGGLDIDPAKENFKLGLDLQGGVYVVLEAETDAEGQELHKLMEQAQAVIESRVNEMGLSEPVVTIESENRIRVELPGVDDSEQAIESIGKTAQLEFIDAWGNVVLTGADVKDAVLAHNNQSLTNEVGISLALTGEGADKFAEATQKACDARGQTATSEAYGSMRADIIMIVLDGEVISSPVVNEPILNGEAFISGSYTEETAARDAALIRGGSLPVTLHEVETSSVGASLGMDAFNTSILAGAIGVLLIIIFMIGVYKIMGVAASVALMAYILIYVWIFEIFGAVLTLPGIAAIILSIGMAVDANVIIFARIREEIEAGKSIRVGVKAGFTRALATILDSNITTLIAGIVLYQFGTGSVKGFAWTLMVGILVSMFSALVLTRLFVVLLAESKAFGKETFFVWSKKLIDPSAIHIPVIEKRRIWYGVMAVVIVVGLGLGLVRGFNFGIDFLGGTMIQIDLQQEAAEEDIQSILKEHGITDASVVHAGEDNQEVIIRTAQSLDSDDRSGILEDIYSTYQVSNEQLRAAEQFSPSVGSELQRSALIAVAIACALMLIYIAFRFELKSGIAAIIALLCDLLTMISIYGLFHIQINSPFIAALLVILGYSINNTIVIFDRIRENSHLDKKKKRKDLVNQSVSQTLSRTMCTSLTTIISIGALLVMGTSSIRNFVFPIMIGLIAGTYSSIFVSGSIWHDISGMFEKKKYRGK